MSKTTARILITQLSDVCHDKRTLDTQYYHRHIDKAIKLATSAQSSITDTW